MVFMYTTDDCSSASTSVALQAVQCCTSLQGESQQVSQQEDR